MKSTATTCEPAFEPARWRGLPGFALHDTALARLSMCAVWPDVADYGRLLGTDVVFVAEDGKLAAGLDDSDMAGSYIARCAEGAVPTRTRNLHDLMNALIWARFPLAKRALCRRQIAVGVARGRHTNRVRSKAQDRLAMIDEGGVVVVGSLEAGAEIVFGHALLEDTIRGRSSRGLRLVVVDGDGDGDGDDDLDLDARFAAFLTALPLPE